MRWMIDTKLAAECEEISENGIRDRIRRGLYPAYAVKKVNRPTGGKQYLINIHFLSSQGMLNYLLK